jgi:hypothetical protein
VILSALAPASPPLDPSVEQARAWLARELSDSAYADDRSILQRVLDWISEQLNRLPEPGGLPSWVLPVVLAVLLGVLVAVLLSTVRRDPSAPGRRRTGEVIDEPHLRADDYRARAAAALDAGDPSGAAADWFRALVAASQERTLLDDAPGRTAHEISLALATVFPTDAGALADAADLFDRVVYGRATVDVAAARGVARLDARQAGTRPVLDAAVAP